MTPLQRFLSLAALSSGLVLVVATPAHAITYTVSFNTSSIAGTTGSVDFQWNLGVIDPTLTAMVSSFGGPAFNTAPVLLFGAVSGDLSPGHGLSFAAGQPFNYVYQNVTYGSTVSFMLKLPDVAPPNGSFASAFAVSLLDSSLNPALPSTSPDGDALLFSLDPGAAPKLQAFTPATVNTVAAVPEPSSGLLLVTGMLAVGAALRRRGREAA